MSRELLFRVTMKDCKFETYRVSGAGGQHRDKTSNGVRITHRASGAVGQCGEDRSQARNKRTAFRRMAESRTFELWRQREAGRLLELLDESRRSAAEIVEEGMAADNLLVEVRQGDEWVAA